MSVKGPFQRLQHDLRRLWECPVCHRRLRAPGQVTALLCPCQREPAVEHPQWMRLLNDAEPRRPWAPPFPPAPATTPAASILGEEAISGEKASAEVEAAADAPVADSPSVATSVEEAPLDDGSLDDEPPR